MLKSIEFLRGKSRGEWSRLLRYSRNDGASNGEGLHRPCCNKILGTDCASRPRMTGAGGVDLVPPPTLPLFFPIKNSLLFNILLLLLCVKKTTVIFTHSKQNAENSHETTKNIANIKSYCKF